MPQRGSFSTRPAKTMRCSRAAAALGAPRKTAARAAAQSVAAAGRSAQPSARRCLDWLSRGAPARSGAP
eukprot:13363078-Alexandrium_andersonii.AAC.1